jgi:hypothetical protein
MEQKIKQILGEQLFTIVALNVQIEQLRAEIETLKKVQTDNSSTKQVS